MEKIILLLTKSSKRSPRTEVEAEQGYCVAGIELLSGEWVRLVAQYGNNKDESLIDSDLLDKNGEVAKPLDVIRVSVPEYVPIGCQVENWLMDVDEYIDILGHASLKGVFYFRSADHPDHVYENTAEFLDEDEIEDVYGSLILIPVKNARIYDTGHGRQRRTKMSFNYNGEEYKDFSMTDPEYYRHQGKTIDYAFLVVSLPNSPLNNGRYYKFVAKILEVTKDEYEEFYPEEPEDELPEADYPEVDYDEYMTVGEAYERYADTLSPLIVISDRWTNDYCFVITGITERSASGEVFIGGHHHSHRYIPLSWSVRIYDGPSKDDIRDFMQDHQDQDPLDYDDYDAVYDKFDQKFGDIDFSHIDYVATLYNKYKDVMPYPIMVKRNSWNMYYLVVKEADGEMVSGDLYWNEGKYYKTVTIVDLQKFQMYQNGYMKIVEKEVLGD